jgi:predicted DNA-binding transcriptional regulator YafY
VRRADRLFEIIQCMRRQSLVRARDLSAALEVSERTIYRDIQDLVASGVPIEGEAGVGYVLRAGFDLPPLMFKEQEIEALVLGARIVESWADAELAAAASDVIAKVQAVIPDRLRDYMANTALLAPPHHYMEPVRFDVAELRRALRSQLKVRFSYRDAQAEASERTVRPLCLAYFGPVWLLSAWCELRVDFRTFRLDRIDDFTVPGERFRPEPGKTLHDFLKRDQAWTRSRTAPNGKGEATPNGKGEAVPNGGGEAAGNGKGE